MSHRYHYSLVSALLIGLCLFTPYTATSLSTNYYAKTCPNVEKIVRQAVQKKIQQTFVTIPGTLRLFFHDCFVNGCDASVIIQSTSNNKAEKDHPDNLSLAGDGFDTVIKAKAAVDAVPGCTNNVSCADILALATRDVVNLSGGPFWQVELGRLDGLISTATSVNGRLPQPSDDLNRLNSLFASNGLSQAEMVALSGAHTVGFSHCNKFSNRIYGFTPSNPIDPTLNPQFAAQLQSMCPKNVDPRIAVNMDVQSPRVFDNAYYKNLINGKGLFTSDQVLYTDKRTRGIVTSWAQSSQSFKQAFAQSMIRLGRVGVKNSKNGNIRIRCDAFN
ncbi:peroxidase 50-like [Chenopodium quinoa]|uniref:Peroxidase n=1 Tax=Chenopodium quinoa TaxID=63459 RepID=A0A803KY75_CHEQI|nr:peroxidase 50-like [Chenopodium quinoa]